MRNVTVAAILGATALASTAHAAPAVLAHLDADLDDDGTPNRLELGADGVLRIDGRGGAPVGTITRGRIEVARFAGAALVVLEVETRTGNEAVVFARGRSRAFEIVTRFPIGGVGLDADYAIEVDATSSGLVRYQRRGDARRCDGKPAYLFAELFDPGTRAFRKLVPPSAIDPGAPRIAATLDRQPATMPLVYRARLASTQPGATDAGGLTIPLELDDGRLETTWREDVGGNGKGHFFTFESRVATERAKQIRIVPGNPKSLESLKANNRPKTIGVATAQGTWWIDLPDPVQSKEPLGAAYVAELPTAVSGCVTIVLEATYPGSAATSATTIAELGIYAETERASGGGEAMLAKLIAEGKDGATNATAALARRGAPGVTALEAELAKATSAVVRRRLVTALATFRDPAAAASLVKATSEGWVRGADLLDVIEALGTFGQTEALVELARQGGVPIEARVAAASRIRPNDQAGLTALIGLAGVGPRELRRAVITAMARAPIASLLPGTAVGVAGSGDVWRAITRQARTTTDVGARAQALAAMVAALATATEYEPRYRLIDGIATIGDAAALRELAKLLAALPASTENAALRQVAIRAVAAAPRTDAMPLVIGLARDTDPGVRMATLGALATADGEPGGPWHAPDGPDSIDRVIITSLSTDTWPEVRRRAAEALGDRCTRVGPATALTGSIAKDRDPGVRIGALTALVQCKAPTVGTLLARLWDDGKAPLELRAHAVDLAVALGDRALGARLVGKLAGWRGEAIESKEALILAQHAAASIGRLAPPGAAQALLAAIDDSAYPEIVSAAALALGALGPACPPAAKAKLVALAREDESLAVAAGRAAAQCGRAP